MVAGDFSHIDCDLTRGSLEGTYKAVSNVKGAWDFLKVYTPAEGQGFMFSSHRILTEISNETENLNVGHSGASWGMCMRHMEYIAKHGWDQYVKTPYGTLQRQA